MGYKELRKTLAQSHPHSLGIPHPSQEAQHTALLQCRDLSDFVDRRHDRGEILVAIFGWWIFLEQQNIMENYCALGT